MQIGHSMIAYGELQIARYQQLIIGMIKLQIARYQKRVISITDKNFELLIL